MEDEENVTVWIWPADLCMYFCSSIGCTLAGLSYQLSSPSFRALS